MTSFSSFADSLNIRFTCPHCHQETSYSLENLPSPDWSGDTAASSENYDDEDFYCEHCGHPYNADIFVNMYEGNLVISDAEQYKEINGVQIEEHFIEDEDQSDNVEEESVVASVMNA